MSSPESARRTVERFPTEAINRGDVAAMDELVAEEDLKGGVASVKDAFPDHTVIPEKLLAADDGHVVAREKYVSRSQADPAGRSGAGATTSRGRSPRTTPYHQPRLGLGSPLARSSPEGPKRPPADGIRAR